MSDIENEIIINYHFYIEMEIIKRNSLIMWESDVRVKDAIIKQHEQDFDIVNVVV